MDITGADSFMAIFGFKRVQSPYLIEVHEDIIVRRKYNPEYGDDRICQCGHPYYRHFDSYDDNNPVGCKYCECDNFVEEKKMDSSVKMVVACSDDIERTFKKLIEEDGSTTTLDVKNDLRARGYWVKQSEVSTVLDAIVSTDDSYTYDIDRNHRIYSKNSAPLPSFIGKPKAVQKQGTWKCSAPGVPVDAYYSNMTRNQARYRFSLEHDTPYVGVRATAN
jgi:hypothetical protein